MSSVQEEYDHRERLWQRLLDMGGPVDMEPGALRDLRMYGGAQGVWVDKNRTRQVDPRGVTVGLLHTGRSYDDDFSDSGVIYHYPKTDRQTGRDEAEVEATKAASVLRLPVFVIRYSGPGANRRTVYRGWVEDWDDDSRLFLITFTTEPPRNQTFESDADPFTLKERVQRSKREVLTRDGQQRFKFKVLQRYGPKCAVCEVTLVELLDAAHVCPKKEDGTDDPRNGLVFCALHHRAFDAGLFAIAPESLDICYRPAGPQRVDLRVTEERIRSLRGSPHTLAVSWHWDQWSSRHGA
jgi:HNH endonuclease